jgi:hypothetical protein
MIVKSLNRNINIVNEYTIFIVLIMQNLSRNILELIFESNTMIFHSTNYEKFKLKYLMINH